MTIALHSHARSPAPSSAARNRRVPLAPAALLTVAVLGFAWLQAGSEADSSLSAPAVAGPAVLPVSAIAAARDVATVPTNGSRGGTSTAQGEQPAGAAVTATTAVAASTEDAVPSLEDQELAGYATAGN